MSFIFKMPDLGEGILEGEIVKWYAKVGDTVKADDTLLEVQNDKMLQEVPAPVSGTITKIMKEEGSVATVGEDLIEFDGDDSQPSPQPESQPEPTQSEGFIFKMPDLGEGILEGEIIKWFVKEGDTINADEPLLEVQNDKMMQEVPAPTSGKVTKIMKDAGAIVNVGEGLVEFDGGGTTEKTAPSIPASPPAKDPKEESAPSQKSQAPKESTITDNTIAGRILAMPSVRQFARDNEVDLTKVSATGRHGHVTLENVETFLSEGEKSPSTPEAAAQPVEVSTSVTVLSDGATTREKMSITRKAIAKAMDKSTTTAAHVSLFDEVNVEALIAHRTRFKQVALDQDIRLTYLAYIVKAVVAVLRKYPILNATIDETTDEIVYKNYFNIGIAVDTEAGLYVPNIKDADTKGVFAIAKEISSLAQSAHDGKLKANEMRNGSTTISNIGSAKGLWFTPVLNYPEVGIFGIGRIDKKPVVLENGALGVASMMALSFSFDHRLVDGMTAQLALNELKRLLHDPEVLLMEG